MLLVTYCNTSPATCFSLTSYDVIKNSCDVMLKAGTHYPYIRAVCTGRIYGPYIRVHFFAPVHTGRIYGPYVRAQKVSFGHPYGPYIRAVLVTKSQARIQYLAVIKMANLIQIQIKICTKLAILTMQDII